MGSGPLAQHLFYQYKCTCVAEEQLLQLGSARPLAFQCALDSLTTARSNEQATSSNKLRP